MSQVKTRKCGRKCEVYSRVVGYHRPVKNWNKGKKEEFKDRKVFNPGTPPEPDSDNHDEGAT
jgi:anaerobic ribonucleoside-triphosphate reductase